MPGKSGSQRNIVEQIEELRRKMLLIEGDRKAYYESAQYTIQQNKDKIAKLRKENKEMRKVMADKLSADEQVVNRGLEDNPVERNALRSKPGNVAIVVMDEKVHDRVNVLNTARYRTKQKQKRLDDLTAQDAAMGKQKAESDAYNPAETDDAQKSRSLENRLDKANLKCKEAEHIHKTYLQIKAKLEDEHKTFESSLDELEQDIRRMKQELKQLQVMRNDAQIARDNAKTELRRQEEEIYADRRKRELELQKVRKEADEKRMQQEKNMSRINARSSQPQDELSSEQRQPIGAGEDDQMKMTTYEDAFRKIKDATGVSDTQEVVLRFENQGDTQQHLERLKADNTDKIQRLREDKDKLQAEFDEMKYSGEASLSSGQRLLEEYQTHLDEEEARREEAQTQLEKCSKILTDVKSGVDHLNEKLKILKTPASQVQKTKLSAASDEYVLEQLSVSEEKLLKLLEDLDSTGKEVNEISKQMQEEEFHNTIQIKLPTYNTRVKLPTVAKDTMYDDEDDSGDDEDVLTRQTLKKQSQQIVEAKNRRRPGGKTRKNKSK